MHINKKLKKNEFLIQSYKNVSEQQQDQKYNMKEEEETTSFLGYDEYYKIIFEIISSINNNWKKYVTTHDEIYCQNRCKSSPKEHICITEFGIRDKDWKSLMYCFDHEYNIFHSLCLVNKTFYTICTFLFDYSYLFNYPLQFSLMKQNVSFVKKLLNRKEVLERKTYRSFLPLYIHCNGKLCNLLKKKQFVITNKDLKYGLKSFDFVKWFYGEKKIRVNSNICKSLCKVIEQSDNIILFEYLMNKCDFSTLTWYIESKLLNKMLYIDEHRFLDIYLNHRTKNNDIRLRIENWNYFILSLYYDSSKCVDLLINSCFGRTEFLNKPNSNENQNEILWQAMYEKNYNKWNTIKLLWVNFCYKIELNEDDFGYTILIKWILELEMDKIKYIYTTTIPHNKMIILKLIINSKNVSLFHELRIIDNSFCNSLTNIEILLTISIQSQCNLLIDYLIACQRKLINSHYHIE